MDGPFIVDLPINGMVIFQFTMLVYQRVCIYEYILANIAPISLWFMIRLNNELVLLVFISQRSHHVLGAPQNVYVLSVLLLLLSEILFLHIFFSRSGGGFHAEAHLQQVVFHLGFCFIH